MFVVLEGIDGSGKSTHANKLANYLRDNKRDVLLTAEPTDGRIGRFIRELLREDHKVSDTAIQLLFIADRAEHVMHDIIPAMQNDKDVVCDRYVLSTIVYGTSAKVDEKFLLAANSGFVVPDATIILNVTSDTAISRIEESRANKDVYFEKRAFLLEASKKYNELAERYPNTHTINSERSEEEVFNDIKAIVNTLIKLDKDS